MANRNKYPDDQSYQDWNQQRNQYNQQNDFNQQQGNSFYDQNSGVKLGNGNANNSGQIARGREMESQGIYNGGNYNKGNYNSGQYNAGNKNEYNNENEQNRVNYLPDNDDNRNYNDRDYDNTQYGTSGTYGYKGNSGNYDNPNYGNEYSQQQYGKQGYGQRSYKADFEKHYYNQGGQGNYVDGYTDNRRQQTNRYGGDTRNYGNANQGAFDRDWWDRTKDEVASWFGDDDAERRRKRDRRTMNGGYKGKGPKNYQRSEERIREDVCDRLTEDDLVDASNIEVQIQASEVVLTGHVTTRDQKRRAEDIVESVAGVAHVENRLRVTPTQKENNTETTNL